MLQRYDDGDREHFTYDVLLDILEAEEAVASASASASAKK